MEVDIVDKFGYIKGKLKKIHNGCYNELCTTADRYELTIPQNEVEVVLLLAAL